MAKVKNISSIGAVEIPAFGITAEAGEVIEVTDEQAASLLEQSENWVAVESKPVISTPLTSGKGSTPATDAPSA